MKKVRILSVDGGGIRGIIPATVLMQLEKIIRKLDNNNALNLGDYFDMVAGTSTGGILSCIYLMPGDKGTAKYSAEEALDFYLSNGHKIFDSSFIEKIMSAEGLIQEKYDIDDFYSLFTNYFQEETINNFIRPSLITSYDITDRKAVFFTSVEARNDDMYNFKVRDVALATSAAPTYFPPAHIYSLNGQSYTLVDGGMFANNPALCAYAEARKIDFSKVLNNPEKRNKPTAKDMIIVSLGTGSVKKKYSYKHFKHAGELKWIKPVIDILMSGNSETVSYQLTQMYLTLSDEYQRNYYRLEPGLKEACSEIDIATAENMNNLYQAGLTYVHDNIKQLESIAESVLKNH